MYVAKGSYQTWATLILDNPRNVAFERQELKSRLDSPFYPAVNIKWRCQVEAALILNNPRNITFQRRKGGIIIKEKWSIKYHFDPR